MGHYSSSIPVAFNIQYHSSVKSKYSFDYKIFIIHRQQTDNTFWGKT